MSFVAHEIVDVPGWGWRAPGEVLRWHDHVKSVAETNQALLSLLTFRRVEEGAVL